MRKHTPQKLYRIGSTLALLGAFCGVALVTRAQAQIEPPIVIDPPRPMPPIWPPRPIPPVLNQELQLISQSADVEIKGALAKTKLTQNFQNTTGRRIEGTYVFPLPEGASISGFAMTVNGKRMEAEILEGDKAREIYQGIVSKLRDPAILEFIDRNLVRVKVFPIEPGATQKMELEYSESLRGDAGSFRYVVPLRLPVGGSAQSASVDIKIVSPDGIKAVYSPTHEIEVKRDGDSARVTGEFAGGTVGVFGAFDSRRRINTIGSDRDFVLYYTTAKTKVGVNLITHKEAGEDGYFMMLVAPDSQIAQAEIPAKDVVFVFDTSGSMAGEKIEQARKALLNLIGNLNPKDRFNIVTFSSDTRTFRDGLIAADKSTLDAARDWAKGIKAVGGTNINDALIEGLHFFGNRQAKGPRERQLIFMTDGQPTVGETDTKQILRNVNGEQFILSNGLTAPGMTMPSPARLFTFGVGFDVNTQLLDTLASDNRGSSDYVLPEEDIEAKVGSLYNKIAFPVLSSPRVDWNGLKTYDVYPKVLPDLFKGTQTIVFGRYEGRSTQAPTLIGFSGGKEQRIAGQGDFSDNDGGDKNETLPRLWATRKIGTLMDDARHSGRTIDPEVKDEIIKLGKKYGIVTPFTAGLITEDESRNSNRIDNPAPASSRAAADAAGGFSGQLSGEKAVLAARATTQYREASKLPTTNSPNANTKLIEGKTFELKNGVWTDSVYDAAKFPKMETIKFASQEYFALMKNSRVAKWLSVGDRVLLMLDKRAIRVEP